MEKFKRGDRVHVERHVPSLTGKTGTVTGRDARGWLRVRFDHQESYEKGIPVSESSIVLYDGDTDAETQQVNAFIDSLREIGAPTLAGWARDQARYGWTVDRLKAELRRGMEIAGRG